MVQQAATQEECCSLSLGSPFPVSSDYDGVPVCFRVRLGALARETEAVLGPARFLEAVAYNDRP